jgi:TolB protein
MTRRLLALLLLVPLPLAAQDRPLDEGVRIGITYNPGVRPSLLVLPQAGLDSARAILARDLDYSDRFEVVSVPAGSSPAGTAVNYRQYRVYGAQYGVDVLRGAAAGHVRVRLHDLAQGKVLNEQEEALPDPAEAGFRMAVHRLSDEVVRWVTGTPGYAASRLAFVGSDGRLWRVDADGAERTAVTAAGERILSPVWAPDGRRVAYTRFREGTGTILVHDLATSRRSPVPGTSRGLAFAAAFSSDGRTVAYARADEDGGTDLFSADVAADCCVRRLTVGRFADNLSPTFAPDGRRIAFVSTRAGPPQVYAMSADGTDQELFAPFSFGVDGPSNGPEWSPDGASVAFHRDIDRAPQIFLLDVAARRNRQLTSAGRNEDPTWAPDGRHLAFVSDRSGQRQLWIVDIETGRVRQIRTPVAVRLPAWSRRLLAGTP